MIGIFDSGVGGLSVYREIRKILPDRDIIYYADSAHCPYGEKSHEYITERAREITGFLISKGADIIVAACNTATAAAISTLRREFDIPFIGMEPAIKPAVQCTITGTVGVLATAGTLKAEKYHDTREQYAENVKIEERVGEGFVELVENGILSGPQADATVSRSLKPLTDAGADVIVLGCTHYPFLSDCIEKTAALLAPERKIRLIDPAPAVARHLVEVMTEKGLLSGNEKGRTILLSSGDSALLENFYSRNINKCNTSGTGI